MSLIGYAETTPSNHERESFEFGMQMKIAERIDLKHFYICARDTALSIVM